MFLIASKINLISLHLAIFAAFLDWLIPLLVIRNAALSKTRETFGRVFFVSFIDCCIRLVHAAAVFDDRHGDGAAVDNCAGATPKDDATCDIASCKRVLIAFLNSTSSNYKSEYRVLT